ncbi:tol-pal system protein YbgF [Desulfovibrio ferrophilus]|uniref:Tol-pal system protein YbgF n=1 Tax=Desulfovibrio ferrophilus TaxID=241368 RepID=A0A2Z6AWX0_9BACT|nr:tol-pal system protein YbgF [Desulfovibrio ferrophilus]BBD07752.1 Tol-pal system protein YbgF [Desulfovibrio ferrophilus]
MKRILIVIMACMALTACVKADDVRTLDNRVYEQKLRLDGIEGKVEQLTSVDPQKADTWSQVQSMRQELADARNELDALNREIQTLKADSEAIEVVAEDVKDLKIGWQRLNSQLGTDVDLMAIRAERTPVPALPTPDTTEAADAVTSEATAATDAANVETPATDTPLPAADPAASTEAAAVAPAATPAPAAQPAVAVNADAASTLYKSARAAFEARDYRQGIALWDEFASTFESHKLVPNALFWQGECYYQMKDYARAVLKYQVVIDKYQKSPKYPTALLKQGISFMRLGRVKAGKLLLADVAKKFPKAAEGKRAEAILKKMN